MTDKSILIVEDNLEYQVFLKALLRVDCDVHMAGSVSKARDLIEKQKPDLILLDIGLETENGFEFCTELKSSPATSEIPVLFLTVRDGTNDKVIGFSVGAHDYIVKSSDPIEIQARVKSILRRTGKKDRFEQIERGGIRIDFSVQRVFLTDGARTTELELTPTEFKILSFLIRNEGKVFSRQKLLNEVWGTKMSVTARSVDTHVHSLRKKMGEQAQKIESVFGAGYRFTSVHEVSLEK